ncbi:hypothetical protein ACRALDRAFT_207770 [Sodiomyces alcalophilus JCM 7366]|uniref:uncharacterized protein n=1 Tax=Sodiomyces alcalophilus JCM 7366 TaxID=591952 RepID=UPI0039B48F87
MQSVSGYVSWSNRGEVEISDASQIILGSQRTQKLIRPETEFQLKDLVDIFGLPQIHPALRILGAPSTTLNIKSNGRFSCPSKDSGAVGYVGFRARPQALERPSDMELTSDMQRAV